MFFETEEEIRRRISRRYRRWTWFVVQLVATLPVGLFIDESGIFGRGFKNFLLALWFAALFFHCLVIFIENARERAIQREIERQQHIAMTYGGKPKRSSRLSLGEDGELLEPAEFVTDNKSKDASTN